MKHIKIYEDFKQGPLRKEPSIFQKAWKGAKDLVGIESSKDREALETIHRIIGMNDSYGFVKNVREIKPGVIVAWLNDQSLTVDTETPEIIWKGKSLDLNDLDLEANTVYRKLIPLTREMKVFGPGFQNN